MKFFLWFTLAILGVALHHVGIVPLQAQPAALTEAEKTLVHRYIAAHLAGDRVEVESILGYGELFDRVVATIPKEQRPPVNAIAGFRAGWLARPEPLYFSKTPSKLSLTPGGMKIIEHERMGDRTRVVIRLLTPKATLPIYQELVLGLDADGKAVVLDYRPNPLQLSATEQIRQGLRFDKERAARLDMLHRADAAGKEAVFEAVRNLRLAAQKDVEVALICVSLVFRHGDEPDRIGILTEFRKHHPGSKASQYVELQFGMKTGQLDIALAAVDGIGPERGDPYLDVLRAKIAFMKDDLAGSVKFARRALNAEPNLPEVYDCLLKIAVDQKDFDGAVSWLRAAKDKCPDITPDLSQDRSLSDFVASKEYQEWRSGR